MLIARYGAACCGIDVLPDAAEPLRYAADELRRFLAQRTGCTLPSGPVEGRAIRVRLAGDDSRYAQALEGCPPESYLVDAGDGGVHLVGVDPAGAVYAAFDFLSTECDVGFAGLGDLGVRAHFSPVVEVHVPRRRRSPDLPYRGLQGAIMEDTIEEAGGVSPIHCPRLDWMARNRMNYYVVHPGQRWDNIAKLLPEVKRRGLKAQWGHHIWPELVTAAKYFDRHPEYFPMRSGERVHPLDCQLNLCTSNPEVARVMADEILAVLDRHPGIDVFSMWPDDGTGTCECPECVKISDLPSGWVYDTHPRTGARLPRSYHDRNKTVRYAKFVNAVARIVAQSHPEVPLSASFYHDIDAPPEGVELEPNVQPVLTHYWRCWRHPLDHPECENAFYERITREWARLCPGRVVIYDYLMGMSCYLSGPWPIVPMMHRDWKRLRQMGIQGATIQSQGSHFTVYGPVYSAFARMGWEMDAPTADLARPYYADLYEEAAGPALELAALLEDRFFREDCEPPEKELIDAHFIWDPVYAEHFPHCIYPNADSMARFLDDGATERLAALAREAVAAARQPRTRANAEKLATAVGYWQLAYRFHRQIAVVRKLSAERSPEVHAAIEGSLRACEEVIEYLERIRERDVVSRAMLLNLGWSVSWPAVYRSLLQKAKSPFSDSPEAPVAWP